MEIMIKPILDNKFNGIPNTMTILEATLLFICSNRPTPRLSRVACATPKINAINRM